MPRIELTEKERQSLASCSLFEGLGEERLSSYLDVLEAEKKEYGKGLFVHQAGTALPRFGLVLSGTVQVCSDDLDGNRMIMANVSSGMTFGESLCFLKIRESPVYIYTFEPSVILWLSCDRLFAGGKEATVRELSVRFTAMLAARTLNMNGRIQILSKKSIRKKLLTLFTDYAREAEGKTFTIPMNRDELAAYVGADRSALSRELSLMKKEGLIDYYRNTFRILRTETKDKGDFPGKEKRG